MSFDVRVFCSKPPDEIVYVGWRKPAEFQAGEYWDLIIIDDIKFVRPSRSLEAVVDDAFCVVLGEFLSVKIQGGGQSRRTPFMNPVMKLISL